MNTLRTTGNRIFSGSGPANTPPLSLAFATTDEERERIFRFRYQIYVTEMGKRPKDADHEAQTLRDELDNGEADLLYATSEGEIVGTLRRNTLDIVQLPASWRDRYRLDAFADYPPQALSYTSRAMVAAEWRGSTLFSKLLSQMYLRGQEKGVRFDFCNCAPSLIELYEQLGYRRYADAFVEHDVGYRVPLVWVVGDLEHLRAVRSPFLRTAIKFPDDPDARARFATSFATHASRVNRRIVDADLFWEILAEKLHREPRHAIPLLDGMTEEEAQRFLHSGTILQCKQGESILRRGDVGDELFVVLEGWLEAQRTVGTLAASIALFGPGQVFGELAFLNRRARTADVIARTDASLLVITQTFLRKSLLQSPDITARFLLNLSLVLCDRLEISTTQWVERLQNEDLESTPPQPAPTAPGTAAGSYAFGEFRENAAELTRLKQQGRVAEQLELDGMRRAGLQPGMRVLDLACGPGVVTMQLARLAHPGLVTGVDLSEDLLSEARKLAREEGAVNVEYACANVYELTLPDHTYDFVYARLLFQHLEFPDRALAQVRRVLKPGGILCVLDIDDGWLTLEPEPKSFGPFTRAAAEGQQQHGGDRFVGRKLSALLTKAGLEDVAVHISSLTSHDIGLKNFLDITTGFKREQIAAAPSVVADQLKDIYGILEVPHAWGAVGVFSATGRTPVEGRPEPKMTRIDGNPSR